MIVTDDISTSSSFAPSVVSLALAPLLFALRLSLKVEEGICDEECLNEENSSLDQGLDCTFASLDCFRCCC